MNRRDFLRQSAVVSVGLSVAGSAHTLADDPKKPWFEISLAQWSLHRAFFGKKADPLDFARIAKNEYGIHAIEYVNQFYRDKKNDDKTVAELKKRAEGEGVRSVLIMCDGEGALGDADTNKRKQAVRNHVRWAEWAKELGCHSIRVNAQSSGSYEEQLERAADGLRQLTEITATMDINTIVENHGGLSSNGEWLAAVMKKVNHPRCGTLPDFGNFNIGGGKTYDRYKGVKELMPFAKGVSAKSHDFDEAGNEIHTDYRKMLQIVYDAGYRGYIGVEYEGSKISEPEGIRATKKLLERIRQEMSS